MKKIIVYTVESIAPHQNMMLHHLERHFSSQLNLIIKKVNRKKSFLGLLRTVALFASVSLRAILDRSTTYYFSSFASVLYAFPHAIFRHPDWIYHSQDWIQDNSNLATKAERYVVQHAPFVIWNESNRAEKIRSVSNRKNSVLIIPTYLPEWYPDHSSQEKMREEIAVQSSTAIDDLVIIFAGGSYSKSRLSQQLVEATLLQDENVVLIFAGPERLPADIQHQRILDLGFLAYEDLLAAMATSDIGVLLYDHESSFGNRYQQPGRLTEYLRSGLRLIATPFPDAERLSRETDWVWTVGGYDIEELSVAIKQAVSAVRHGTPPSEDILTHCKDTMSYESAAGAVIHECLRVT